MNWRSACHNSRSGEAKRFVKDDQGNPYLKNGHKIYLYIKEGGRSKKGYRIRQVVNGAKVRLARRFDKDPNDFNDWYPAIYKTAEELNRDKMIEQLSRGVLVRPNHPVSPAMNA